MIANAYETQSIIYTSNLEFSRWGTILGDTNMAAAIIDRTVHHGRILNFTGTSWRLSHSTMK
ncbi:MAG: ATP-binding protein [Varibaculum sp.]|nr:ATP-binding protein [Varibaculum sp.]